MGQCCSGDVQLKGACFYFYSSLSLYFLFKGEFMQLTNDNIHLRTAHSKLLGYWTTEYGGLNEVTHLWQYG